ncbi:MAG: polysaccharide deacetylase family protein [Clostridia bacterium]|nr:polysaccharide deacetylase family protein [Clostridia bacterium]
MKRYTKLTLAIVLSSVLFTGCISSKDDQNRKIDNNIKDNESVLKTVYENDNKYNEIDSNLDSLEVPGNLDKEDDFEENEIKEIDLQEIKPNEVGQIMVLMYHGLGNEERAYVRTRENFKEDLQLLYEKGYRLISLKDYINNDIDTEAGKTPVVLTFDDGNITDFNIKINEKGEKIIDPNCVIGILEEFNKKYPDFGLEATFSIFGQNPFRQKNLIDYKLKYIIDKGMDIGNHTYSHNNLSSLSEDDIQRTLAKNVEFIQGYLPDYEVNILALPYGIRPKNEEKRKYLFSGSFDGVEYKNIGALAVGWKPEYASIHKKFDYRYIHRVHGSSERFGIRYWLEYFDNHPEKRYISDGDKDIVTLLEAQKEVVDEDKLGDKDLRTYSLEEKSE